MTKGAGLGQISYFYDEPMPNRHAASIQILRTGAEHARQGVPFRLHCGALSADPTGVLAQYGLQPTTGLNIEPLYPRRWLGRLRPLVARRRTDRAVRRAEPPGRHVVVARGAAAFDLLPRLAKARDAGGLPPETVLIFEMHRLLYLKPDEAAAGASVEDLAPCTPEARVLYPRERAAFRAADGVACVSEGLAEAAQSQFGAHRVLLLPGGTDVRPPPEAAPNKRYDLVYAGKLERRKGLFDLLEALGHLPGVTLAVAGGGPDAVAAARAIAERLGVADRVDFLGWVAPADVPALLQSARIGCCPLPQGVDHVSDSFTVPLKMLQMMGLGLPIVATDIGPVRNLVEHEVHALLPPPSAPSALADAARRLIGDEALSRRLGSAARARAESYAWPNRAARFATFAEELPMSGERPASAIKPG